MNKIESVILVAIVMFATISIISCSSKDGLDGEDGKSCTLKKNGNSPVKIICGDEETVTPLCGNEMYKFNSVTKECEIDFSKLTEEETKVLIRMRNPKKRINANEAVEQANWVVDFLNSEELGVSRKIKSISALASDDIEFVTELKSNGIEVPDTLIYVVNFDDSLGFAIISADTRIDGPILAFTGSGSLIDSMDNPGFAIFLEHLEYYMFNSIVEAERQKDSLIYGLMEKLDVEASTKATFGLIPITFDPSQVSEITNIRNKINPLVLVEWGQGAPFNNNVGGQCNNSTGNNKYWAGCVAVAVAQIMSRWKYPSQIGNYSFNWTELNKYTGNRSPPSYPDAAQIHINKADTLIKSQIANLMKQIGNGVGMNYGCEGSGANKYSGPNFLLSNGFLLQKVLSTRGSYTALLTNYNSAIAIASMNRREPLIMSGCSKSEKKSYKIFGFTISTNTSYSDCHSWVIDGYLNRQTTVYLNSNDIVIVNEYDDDYIHNNWGWNGRSNGYYKSGIFNANLGGADISSHGITKSGEDYNYQYRIEMTPYISR